MGIEDLLDDLPGLLDLLLHDLEAVLAKVVDGARGVATGRADVRKVDLDEEGVGETRVFRD